MISGKKAISQQDLRLVQDTGETRLEIHVAEKIDKGMLIKQKFLYNKSALLVITKLT